MLRTYERRVRKVREDSPQSKVCNRQYPKNNPNNPNNPKTIPTYRKISKPFPNYTKLIPRITQKYPNYPKKPK
jgi:hypothetical protein